MELRLNEHYTSVQGEGPNVGQLTQFVRFSGCNMRCPGWPCDTPHAIFPKLWKDDPKLHPDTLVQNIQTEGLNTGARHICLTGGEPLLQNKDALHKLISDLLVRGFTFDIFSNGSFVYPSWLLNAHPSVTIVMDWKLIGSGEADTRVEERLVNLRQLRSTDCVKFVVTDEQDLDQARALTHEWRQHSQFAGIYYVGAAWGKIDDDRIVDYIKYYSLPWRLNVQVHKHIWGEIRGI